jgi:membrane-associated phospholipid phosphatase
MTEAATSEQIPLTWGLVARTLTRPYRVTLPMIVLVSLVPLYLFISTVVPERTMHAPEVPLDRMIPLQPGWALVYGSLYLFLILLPVFIVCREEHIRRTVFAYLMVWITAFGCFLLYPTVAPRPHEVLGRGFLVWGLRFLYDADPPYNCFPSLHVAHSCVSAFTAYRAHRGVGLVAGICALLVGISTLFTKQHYVLDVVAGIGLAYVAHVIFLRGYPRSAIPPAERRVAPAIALVVMGLVGCAIGCYWIAYVVSGGRQVP